LECCVALHPHLIPKIVKSDSDETAKLLLTLGIGLVTYTIWQTVKYLMWRACYSKF